jgi:hypothetical protein
VVCVVLCILLLLLLGILGSQEEIFFFRSSTHLLALSPHCPFLLFFSSSLLFSPRNPQSPSKYVTSQTLEPLRDLHPSFPTSPTSNQVIIKRSSLPVHIRFPSVSGPFPPRNRITSTEPLFPYSVSYWPTPPRPQPPRYRARVAQTGIEIKASKEGRIISVSSQQWTPQQRIDRNHSLI